MSSGIFRIVFESKKNLKKKKNRKYLQLTQTTYPPLFSVESFAEILAKDLKIPDSFTIKISIQIKRQIMKFLRQRMVRLGQLFESKIKGTDQPEIEEYEKRSKQKEA
jgi:hypothetical protein